MDDLINTIDSFIKSDTEIKIKNKIIKEITEIQKNNDTKISDSFIIDYLQLKGVSIY